MKFSIGDIVLLKHTGSEGRVVGIINKEMLEVEVGGTHFPVFIDEMEHPYLSGFTEQRQQPVRAVKPLPQSESALPVMQVASGFHLSFLPVFRFDEFDDIVDKLKIYFLNQTHQEISVQYECTTRSGVLFSYKGLSAPFTRSYLHDIPFEQMNEQPRFSYILELTHPDRRKQLQDSLRIKPRKLFEYISLLQKENKPMFSVLLASDLQDAELDRAPVPVLRTDRPEFIESTDKKAPVAEIDLHAEALKINTTRLSNYEILLRQLDKLESALSIAIQLHQQSMIVIHGVGKGKLREEVHALLRSYREVDFFLHDWSPKYGYGATQVFFR